MSVRKIETELSLSGEKQFNDQMKAVNSNLKTLRSEMALVADDYKGMANSTEALTEKQKILQEQYGQQKEKVEALEKMLKRSRELYGDNSSQVDRYHQQLNEAKIQLNKFSRELEDTNRYLSEAEKSADGCARSIDEWGKEVKDSAGDLDDLGEAIGGEGGGGLLGSFGKLKGFLVGGAVVGAVKGVADAVVDLVDSTEEYRKIMGTLETSSAQAGYSVEQTEAAYKRLYEVLGDSQSAATTVANLQAIGLDQENLIEIIDLCTGAWATYGDSIPIDSLAESVNETIQAGKVTGVFADALNWAGTNEDEFNEKLAETEDKSERARIVLDELKRQGLDQTAQAWRDNNEAIVNMHQAQDEWERATGKLGEALAPAVAYIRGEFASALNWVADTVTKAIGLIDQLNQKEIGTNLPSTQPGNYSNITGKYYDPDEEYYGMSNSYLDAIKNGKQHAGGLSYVPYDGYLALLHRGERVLTAGQAAVSRGGAASAPASSAGGMQVIELHTTVELDRRAVGESVTRYQMEQERAGR